MSFRSSLAAPSSQSGQVGQTIIVAAVAQALAANTTSFVCQTKLSKGLWSVQTNTLYTIPTGTTVLEIWNQTFGGVIVPPATLAPVNLFRTYSEPLLATVTAASTQQQHSSTVIVNVTEDDYSIQNEMRMDYSGGTGVTIDAFPNPSFGLGGLVCVKLA